MPVPPLTTFTYSIYKTIKGVGKGHRRSSSIRLYVHTLMCGVCVCVCVCVCSCDVDVLFVHLECLCYRHLTHSGNNSLNFVAQSVLTMYMCLVSVGNCSVLFP